MNRKIFALILFVYLLSIDIYPVVIKLKKEVEVCGLYIELSQIGEIINGNEEIKNIKICKIPEKPMKLDSSIIRKILENKLKQDFVIEGESVFIKPLNTILLPQEIVEKIRNEALRTYSYLSPESIQIILTSPLKEIKLPQADIQVKVSIPKTNTNKTKAARIEIIVDNDIYNSFIITFNLVIKSRVIKAKKDIPRGTILTKELIREEISEVYFSNEGAPPLTFSSYNNFIGKKIICNVKSGDFIYESCFKQD